MAWLNANYGDKKITIKPQVDIYNVDGHVIKFFYDQEIARNRVERTCFLKDVVPEVISSRPNFYKYEYVKGDLYSNIANISNFHLFLDWAKSNLWKPVNTIDLEHFKKIIFDFYYNKTIKRVSDFQKSRSVTDK